VKLAIAWKGDGELGGEWQEDFKSPVPLEIRRREMFVPVSIVADCADVVGDKASCGLCHLVVGNDWIVGLAKTFLVDEGEMAHVEKAFDLSARGGFDIDAVRVDLNEVGVFPLTQFRQALRAIVGQTDPDKAVLFLGLIHVEV
jgi:hypothetical protein